MMPSSALLSLLDVAADRTVLPGYTRAGFLLRSRCWPEDDPAPFPQGRVAVVTGANSGIGRATVAGLARLGASVVMVVRDPARGARAREQVLREVPGAELVVRTCDVADLQSVRAFAAEFTSGPSRVDILVHNAGTLPATRTTTRQGHESTFATHVLGPVLLTELLRPALAQAGQARVVLMSSGGMYTQRLRADDPEFQRGHFRGASAYARTKRMQVALLGPLSERHGGVGIGVHGMHPGWADTPGVADSLPGFHRLTGPLLRSPAQGADTAVWLAATRTSLPSGRFWHDRRVRPTHYVPLRGADPEQVSRLWRYCRTAAGLEAPAL